MVLFNRLNNSYATMSINISIRCPYFRVPVIRDPAKWMGRRRRTKRGGPFTLKSHFDQEYNNTLTGKILIAQVSPHLQKLSFVHPTSQDTPPTHSKAHISIKLMTWHVVFTHDNANRMIVKLAQDNWKHVLHDLYTYVRFVDKILRMALEPSTQRG